MTMNSSGSLAFGGPTTGVSVNLEIGQSASAAISFNTSAFRSLANIPTGSINLGAVYGRSYYRYGTPSGSRGGPGGTYVFLYINGGQPYAPFYIYLTSTTSGQPAPGYAAPYPGYLDANGDWANSYNVAGDPYWYPGPYTNYFSFYQGSTGPYPNGTFIGQVILST